MFNFFKKQEKPKLVFYIDQQKFLGMRSFIQTYPDNFPLWIKNYTLEQDGPSEKASRLNYIKNVMFGNGFKVNNIQKCYGIRELYKNSIQLLAPCDIALAWNCDEFKVRMADPSFFVEDKGWTDHPSDQWKQMSLKYYNFKVSFAGIRIINHSDTPVVFSYQNPFYSEAFLNDGSLEAFPGLVPFYKNLGLSTTVNFGVRRPSTTEWQYKLIKAGDPMVLLVPDKEFDYSYEPMQKLDDNPNIQKNVFRTKFQTSFVDNIKYARDLLKNKNRK